MFPNTKKIAFCAKKIKKVPKFAAKYEIMKQFYKIVYFVVVLCIFNLTVFAQNVHYSKVKIYLDGKKLSELAQLGIAVENGEYKKDVYYIGELSDREIEKIKDKSFRFDLLMDNITQFYQERNKESHTHFLQRKEFSNFSNNPLKYNIIPTDTTKCTIINYNIPNDAKDAFLIVLNSIGQKIHKQRVQSGKKIVKLDTYRWENGVYFYQIASESNVFFTRKILINH